MRTDLTVRTATGSEHDLAVLAPSGTTWQAVSAAVGQAAGGAEPAWCGRRRLDPRLVLGQDPLVTGAVLSVAPPPPPDTAEVRLEVVGGHDCGTTVALRHGLLIGRDPACDLVLTDPAVSRRHAMVSVSADQLRITDLDSTGGVFLGSRRVRSAALSAVYPVRVGADLLAVTAPARRPPVAPSGEIASAPQAAPDPAATGRRFPLGLFAAILPAIGLAWLTGSWEFLAFAALGPLGALGAAAGSSRPGRVRQTRGGTRRRSHRRTAELARGQAAVAAALHAELVERLDHHPHPAALLRAVDAGAGQAADGDTVVRVGLGTVAARLATTRGGERSCAGRLPDAPVTVDLGAGPVGLAGSPELAAGLACWLVAQFAARAPAGARCVVVDPAGLTGAHTWRWLRWLGAGVRVSVEVRSELPTDRRGDRDGTAVLALARDADGLPPWCTSTVQAAEPEGSVLLHSGNTTAMALADRIAASWCDSFARALARRDALSDDGAPGRAGDAPAACRLSDLLAPGSPADLRQRWSADDGSARAPIGRDADGTLVVDLDADGPHALVAGSTGAGKSELLQCLVAGLALEHPPERISFLLIDYKGGAAFADCAGLPHTVGVVTDLDAQLTGRVLRSLDSELHRRERLLAAAGVADLSDYRARAPESAPARLVIVVDEFATLAEELPAFVTGLVAIARRGRSLGLHLVLATQRPAGVVSPEIRANCALRICLRVTSAAESADVVEIADAATISAHTPGRGYLRRGGHTTRFQTAQVSAPAPTSRMCVLPVAEADDMPAPAGPDTELRSIVALVRTAASDAPPPHRPWLEPLAGQIPLSTLPTGGLSRLAVGLVDRPDEQEQPVLTVDLAAGAAISVAGRSGSGRTTVLQTLAVAAAAAAPPEAVHIHAIDAAGSGLAGLLALPHVGTVASAGDGLDLAARLVARLLGAARPPGAPRRLLLVDGWEQLCAASDDFDGGRTVERILALARTARATATTVVLAGGRAILAGRVTAVATTRFVLALNDAADYLTAGPAVGPLADDAPPGRAIRVGDGAEVQFAVGTIPVRQAGTPRPAGTAERLGPLPDVVHLDDLEPGPGVCVAVGGDRIEPIRLDLLGSGAWLLVAGPPRSGRTTLLQTVLAQAPASACLVAAPPRSPLLALARETGAAVLPEAGSVRLPPRGLALVDDVEQLADSGLADELDRWLADGAPGRAVVAAGRTEAVALGYRGLVSRLRSACSGIALHPSPGDPPVFGVPVPAGRVARPPGRGVLVPDPRWGLGLTPIPVQIPTTTPVGAVPPP